MFNLWYRPISLIKNVRILTPSRSYSTDFWQKKKHTLLIVSRLKQSEKGREHNIIGLIWEETKPVCGFSSITLYLIVVHFNQTELSVRKTNVWFVNHRTVVNPLLIDMKTALFYRFD